VALCSGVPYLRCLPLGDPLGDRFRLLAGLGWGALHLLVPLGAAFLEPISKSPEEDNEAGKLNKAQEVLGVVLPADEDSALPLDPGEEALNEPAAHIAG
jgi:hypothetical protein